MDKLIFIAHKIIFKKYKICMYYAKEEEKKMPINFELHKITGFSRRRNSIFTHHQALTKARLLGAFFDRIFGFIRLQHSLWAWHRQL